MTTKEKRINKKFQYLAKRRIPEEKARMWAKKDYSYIKLDEHVKDYQKQQKKARAKARKQQKYNKMIEAGIDEKEAKLYSSKDRSWKEINQRVAMATSNKEWMSIMWGDKTGENDLLGDLFIVKNEIISIERQLSMVYDHLDNILSGDDVAYPLFYGFAIVVTADNESKCRQRIEAVSKRGYSSSKMMYNKASVTCSNWFEYEQVVNILFVVIRNIPLDNAMNVWRDMGIYMKNNFPEIYNRIWVDEYKSLKWGLYG